jgi:hypothetical protein
VLPLSLSSTKVFNTIVSFRCDFAALAGAKHSNVQLFFHPTWLLIESHVHICAVYFLHGHDILGSAGQFGSHASSAIYVWSARMHHWTPRDTVPTLHGKETGKVRKDFQPALFAS